MKINGIQNTTSFERFRVDTGGVMQLAHDFTKKPELEERFIKTIVEPLKDTNTDVFFNGYSTYFKNLDGIYSSIVQAYKGSNEFIVRDATGPNQWVRNIFRSRTNTPVEPVKVFSEYPFKEFEAAKNIALNIALDDKGVKLSEEMEPVFVPPGHPLTQKANEILDLLA